MSPTSDDPLAAYYEEPTSDDPLANYYEDAPDQVQQNPTDRELAAQGYEPDITDEFERMYEMGDAEAARGLVAGATLGLSKLVPGLKPGDNIAALGGEFIGSFVPINALANVFSKPLIHLASKSPILQSQLSSLGQMMGMGATGAVVGGLEEATKTGSFEMPKMEDFLAHGAIWAGIDAAVRAAGYTGRFAKGLYNAVKNSGSSEAKVMNELASRVGTENLGNEEAIAEKALSVLDEMGAQKSSKELKMPERDISKTEAVAEEQMKQIEQTSADLRDKKVVKLEFNKPNQILPEPYLPEQFNPETIVEEVVNNEIEQALDSFAARSENEMELGQKIAKDIEATNEKAEKVYSELYDTASKGAEGKSANVKNTANSVLEQVQKIDAYDLETMPEGYRKVRKQLMDILTDLGFGVEVDELGKATRVIKSSDISLKKAIELKKRANKLVNYDLQNTGAQDFIKDVLPKLRQDIRVSYGPKKTPERKAFEKAEELFGENAEKLKTKAAKSARFTEKPESTARLVRTPSGFADVKQVVSPEQLKQIERSLLDRMQQMTEDKARTFYREFRPQLSNDAKNIAEQIIESKIPAKAPGKKELQRQKIQSMFLDDISQASITGERPDRALKLWKTPEGQQIIKESLKDNPNKEKVLKYLQDQSYKDFAQSIIKDDGKLDFKKLKLMLKDKATVDNLRMIGGEDAVQFLRHAEQLSNRVDKNFQLISGKIDKFTADGRKEVTKALERKGKERIARAAQKQPTKAEKIANELISPEGAKGRKEVAKAATERGEQKLGKIAEERKNNDVFRKFDDWMKSLSESNKTLMTIFGIKMLGASTLGGGILAAKVLEKAVKSPAIRSAFRKAASSKSESPVYFINAIENLNTELED